jgi:hypothetical protein
MFCDRTYNFLCNLDAVQFLCSATKISSSCKIDGGALVEYIKNWKKLVVCGMCCAYTTTPPGVQQHIACNSADMCIYGTPRPRPTTKAAYNPPPPVYPIPTPDPSGQKSNSRSIFSTLTLAGLRRHNSICRTTIYSFLRLPVASGLLEFLLGDHTRSEATMHSMMQWCRCKEKG